MSSLYLHNTPEQMRYGELEVSQHYLKSVNTAMLVQAFVQLPPRLGFHSRMLFLFESHRSHELC